MAQVRLKSFVSTVPVSSFRTPNGGSILSRPITYLLFLISFRGPKVWYHSNTQLIYQQKWDLLYFFTCSICCCRISHLLCDTTLPGSAIRGGFEPWTSIGLSCQTTNPPFGGCAIYFHNGVITREHKDNYKILQVEINGNFDAR